MTASSSLWARIDSEPEGAHVGALAGHYFPDPDVLHLPVFQATICPQVVRAFGQVFADHEGVEISGALHFGGRLRVHTLMLELHPDLIGPRDDPRVSGVVRSLMSGKVQYRPPSSQRYGIQPEHVPS